MSGFDPSQPRDRQGRWTKGNGVAVGVAATIVLSGIAGGGMGGTSVSSSVDAYGTRISRSGESNARARSDARANGEADAFKITSRLKGQGDRVTVQAEPKQTNCEDYSNGDVPAFFREHPCQSLYRQLIEIEDKKNIIMLGMTTIQMRDPQAAMDLKILLDRADRGEIIQLSRASGKFRHFSFNNSLFKNTLYGTIVTAYDAQIVSGAVGDFILIAFLNNALFGIG
jgi:hypothetical protein